ncbi:DUF3885 domain-containing protein [Metabacillus fastidiosus]|uniref:DUF3885 domain-containing protein n=1 Tax=Metabacillus fastidiosus TaxID=1458 RepID=UPI002DB8D229|nr:DUF3885 domain-containing protein [Metabacillus fastidiosus]MEC2076372.1 DUF3885 domain-containing protein [Metabacillus fastidiosus]
MELKEYMNFVFPGLILKPSLYYQWDTRIHFELAKGLYQFKSEIDELNDEYFNRVYDQTTTLFNEIFSHNDELFLVTNVYKHKGDIKRNKKIKVYNHYINNKNIRFQLKEETLPYMFDDDDADEYYTSQFSLKCQKQDIRYPVLLKAICNQDFPPLRPRFNNRGISNYPDLFFINIKKNIIFYIYDDRGCEVIASDIEAIRPIYEKYNEWIDEYCREDTEQLFK